MTEMKRPIDAATVQPKKPKLITEFFAQVGKKTVRPKPAVKNGKSKDLQTNNAKDDANTKSTEEIVVKTSGTTNEEKEDATEVNDAALDLSVPKSDNKSTSHSTSDNDYSNLCEELKFNKQEWIDSLSEEQRQLLSLEIHTMHISWLAVLHKELTKPYFLKLKKFLHSQKNKTVFPPPGHIYSWSHFTPLPEVKCLILGQDPYHNFNQAHGLAFLVLEPTRPPPSLLNIYKTLKIDFPSFEIPDYKVLTKQGKPGGGNLTKWAKRGVLMLNACLTVEAHKANSHANQGWEQFTEQVIKAAITYAKEKENLGFVIMAWGTPAQKRVANFAVQLNSPDTPFLVLKTVHPSPLSASRGFFDLKVFARCNEWLADQGKNRIDWGLFEGNVVTGA